MSKKTVIGIDINEILRSRFLQFDRYYVEEFGEENAPESGTYVFDFWKNYKWEDTVEEVEILNEELPEDINPLDYQVDPETGEAPVDFLALKKEKNELTAKQVYNRFLYEDYCFEIFGSAPKLYKQVDLDFEKFFRKYSEQFDIRIFSKENWFSIPPTLFFLSKIMTRVKHYHFVETNQEVWDNMDIVITTDPELMDSPKTKKTIKLSRPYNEDLKSSFEAIQLVDLIDNEKFENFIGYKKPIKDKEE